MLLDRTQPRPDPVALMPKTVSRNPATGWYRQRGKCILDICLAVPLLILTLPFMIVIALLVARDGHNPVFSQERVGQHGRRFRCYKFRTMIADAEEVLDDLIRVDPKIAMQWVELKKIENDPRVTRLGRFLRETSLDELPQLFNVLIGDMSMVGPRPIVEDELFHYGANVHKYLALRPGATGLWQIYGRGKVGYAERVGLDALYHDTHSLRSDLLLCGLTWRVVMERRGQ